MVIIMRARRYRQNLRTKPEIRDSSGCEVPVAVAANVDNGSEDGGARAITIID
jgi:hypothetical protein